jgi:hypothetical protein
MNRIVSFLPILLSILLISCKHDIQIIYPVEPHLDFKNIRIATGLDILGNIGDSLILYLNYTDGDANIGRNFSFEIEADQYNCITTFYKKNNGMFSLIIGDNFISNPEYLLIQEIPEPNRTYNMGPITVKTRSIYEGELQINFFLYAGHNPYNIGDTVKIAVQIIDNDYNNSNIAEMEKVFSY